MVLELPWADAVLRLTANDDKLKSGLDNADRLNQNYAQKWNSVHEKMVVQHGRYMEQMKGHLDNFLAHAKEAAEKITHIFTGLAIGGGAAGGAGAFGILKLGALAVESENLFDVALGKMAQQARAFSEVYSSSMRLNAFETRRNLGTLDVFLKSMGMAEKPALQWSTALTKLTNDLSSFYNISRQVAFEKVMSGIAGEVRPMRDLGIDLAENAVKAYALAHGMVNVSEQQAKFKLQMMENENQRLDLMKRMEKGPTGGGKHSYAGIDWQEEMEGLNRDMTILMEKRRQLVQSAGDKGQLSFELDDLTKLQARLGLMMERSRTAQGDLARTLTSPMNVLRSMKDALLGAFSNVGKALLEDNTPLARGLKKIGDWVISIAARINAWANSDGPKRLEEKIVHLWEVAKSKAITAWDTIRDKFNQFRNSFEEFWEKHKSWLKPLLITGGIAGAGALLTKFVSGGSSGAGDGTNLTTPVCNVYAQAVNMGGAPGGGGGGGSPGVFSGFIDWLGGKTGGPIPSIRQGARWQGLLGAGASMGLGAWLIHHNSAGATPSSPASNNAIPGVPAMPAALSVDNENARRNAKIFAEEFCKLVNLRPASGLFVFEQAGIEYGNRYGGM
jgi:hypothetical protein